jgi:subtilase family serine protease
MGSLRRLRLPACLTAAVLLVLCTAASAGARGAPPHRLAGTHPGWAVPGRDRGRSPGGDLITFSIWLRWRNQAQLHTLLRGLYDPASAQYHRWLSPRRFEQLFAPDGAQVEEVAGWLRSQGFSVGNVPANRLFVTATGTVAQVDRTFQVTENGYRVGGRTVQGPNTDPAIPAGLTAAVDAITGLDGGMTLAEPLDDGPAPPPPAGRSAPPCSRYWGEKTSAAYANPYHPGQALPWVICGYTPAQIASAYGYGGLHARGEDGHGTTIAITGAYFSPTIWQDANHFAREFRLPPLRPGSFAQVAAPGRVRYPSDPAETQSWYVEQALDVEWAHAAAPGARIVYVGAANDGTGLDQALNYAVDTRVADVVSNSWGAPEAVISPAEAHALNAVFEQGAAEGMSMLFASGDYGDSADLIGVPSPDLPASSPWVTAVGGTSLAIDATGQELWQSAWGTDTTAWDGAAWAPRAPGEFQFGSGGGYSGYFPEPWYQRGVAADPAGSRAVPDVALVADPNTGAVFSQTYRWPDGRDQIIDSWIGGTSLATPIMAGIAAMADQDAHGSLGLLNPALYPLAGSPALADVTAGHTDTAELRNEYQPDGSVLTELVSFARDTSLGAAPGWDDATGLGTPWTPDLVQALATRGYRGGRPRR